MDMSNIFKMDIQHTVTIDMGNEYQDDGGWYRNGVYCILV